MATKKQTLAFTLTTTLATKLLTVPWDKVYQIDKLQITNGATPTAITLRLHRKTAVGNLLNGYVLGAYAQVERYLYYLRPGDYLTGGESIAAGSKLLLVVTMLDTPSEEPLKTLYLGTYDGNDTTTTLSTPVVPDLVWIEGYDKYLLSSSTARNYDDPTRFLLKDLGGKQWRDINFWFEPLYDGAQGFNIPLDVMTWEANSLSTHAVPTGFYAAAGQLDDAFNNSFAAGYAVAGFSKGPAFDFRLYQGTGAAQEIAHDLGQAPTWIIGYWVYNPLQPGGGASPISTDIVMHHASAYAGGFDYSKHYYSLDASSGYKTTGDTLTLWQSITSTGVTLGPSNVLNEAGWYYALLMFADVDTDEIKLKTGTYTGNGTTAGPAIDVGFKPRMIFVKQITRNGGTSPEFGSEPLWIENITNPVPDYQDNFIIMNGYGRVQGAYGYNPNDLFFNFLETGFQPGCAASVTPVMINRLNEKYIYTAIS